MRAAWRLGFLLSTLVALCHASALTTHIPPNARQCYYIEVDKAGEKIGFYFAVQSGGEFDINFEAKAPTGKNMLSGRRERQGDYVFTANDVGEYEFCFENDMSTLTDKLVDFDLTVESEPRREVAIKAGQISEQTTALEESIFKLNDMLQRIRQTQRQFHTRERRGFSTVESTQSRIFWYAIFDSLAVIGMAAFQVYILQTFFTNTGRRYKV